MNKNMLLALDGLLLGDGYVNPNHNTKVGRVSMGLQHLEFLDYCMSFVKEYEPEEPKIYYGKKDNGIWTSKTHFHPDLYEQYLRWYPGGKKDIPEDIELTPTTVLLWYLGDGSLSAVNSANSRSLYFATNSFPRKSIENILVPKLEAIGVETLRITPDNRLFIATRSIPVLLDYMGGKSPVACYDYKFEIEEWRKWKTMKEAAKEVDISYNRLASWVKHKQVDHSRSPGGKKVMFTDEQIEALKAKLDNGEKKKEGQGKNPFLHGDVLYDCLSKLVLISKNYQDMMDNEYVLGKRSTYIKDACTVKIGTSRRSGKTHAIVKFCENRNNFGIEGNILIISVNAAGAMGLKHRFDNKKISRTDIDIAALYSAKTSKKYQAIIVDEYSWCKDSNYLHKQLTEQLRAQKGLPIYLILVG